MKRAGFFLAGGLAGLLLCLWLLTGGGPQEQALERPPAGQAKAREATAGGVAPPAGRQAAREGAAGAPARQQPAGALPPALRIEPHQPEGPPGSLRGRVAHLPGGGSPGERTAEEIAKMRRERNQAWLETQQRRNALRVRVLRRAFGLDDAASRQLGALFETQLQRKLTLLRRAAGRAIAPAEFHAGMAELRRRTAAELQGLLGQQRYLAYAEMERQKRFGLPEEHRKPPR